jgi:putative toxin-antitoxin system antitoxin component (TIGR02293 family)
MQHSEFTPEKASKGVSARVMARVGSILHIGLKTPLDVVRVSREGIVTSAVDLLVDQGFNRRDLAWIIPLRTLTHRREKGQKLTTDETERWLRAAKISALAQEVLGADKAMAWLNKPRKVFDGLSAMELIKTEPGASLVEETLIQLDEGYF